MALAGELRCLVCQSQSLADSHAGLADDLKNKIREKMKQGKSDLEIVDYMVARYGDFVLCRLSLEATTFMLWFGPLLLLSAGLAALFYRLTRRQKAVERELTEMERARVVNLLSTSLSEAEPR